MMIPFEKNEIEGSIAQRFDKIVAQCPERVAIKIPQTSLTYREADTFSNRIAWAILAPQTEKLEQIAVLSADPVLMIIAILGILKAGKCYVLLDPALPQARMLHILKDAQVGLMMTTQQFIPLLKSAMGAICPLINLEEVSTRFTDEKLNVPFSPTCRATIFYTSGSGGEPKGVIRDQRSMLYSAFQMSQSCRIEQQKRYALLSMFGGFGWTSSDIFGALLNGIALHLCNMRQHGIAQLMTWLHTDEITIFHPASVSVFRQLLSSLNEENQFPKLRFIILGGDPLYHSDIEQFRRWFVRDCRILHRFSSTEAGRVTELVIERDTFASKQLIPVGYPVGDNEIFLFDETGQKISVGNVGEIGVRSRYLAPGYWNDPELTRRKFLPDPEGGDKRIFLTGDLGRMRPDGCLEYLGRKDFMVKIRGYRVVLTEIEAALYALEQVQEAVVVAKERTEGEKFLVAYVVPSATLAPTVSDLRQALAATLPDYMLPSFFVFLDALPLAPTGKVDRQALPEPDYTRPELTNQFVAPRTPDEIRLAEIWAKTLGLDRVGIHDNFFELGGNSILAGKVLSDIKPMFGLDLPMRALFQSPTIAAFAEQLRQQQPSNGFYSVVPIQTNGTLPPLFFMYPLGRIALHYSVQGTSALAKLLGDNQPLYGVRYGLAATQDAERLPHTPKHLEELAAHYLQEIRTLQPTGPYYLCGRSGGGMVAFEMACQLREQGQQVALLVLLDTVHPFRFQSCPNAFRKRLVYTLKTLVNRHRGPIGRFRTRYYLSRQQQRSKITAIGDAFRHLYTLWAFKRQRRPYRYLPRPYQGKIILFESAEPGGPCEARWGWEQSAAGSLEIIPVPGWHGNMMEEEANLIAMATQLRQCLTTAQRS